MLDIESKGIPLREPAGNRRLQRFDQFAANVQKGQARRSQQVFQSSRNVEINIRLVDVDPTGAAVLVIIQHDQRDIGKLPAFPAAGK